MPFLKVSWRCVKYYKACLHLQYLKHRKNQRNYPFSKTYTAVLAHALCLANGVENVKIESMSAVV